MHALAIVLGVIAAGCMVAAIVGMVAGRPGPRAGWVLRALAVICFVGAVVLNSVAHHH
jgi:hypothetical protein